jgi:hypothetical protein
MIKAQVIEISHLNRKNQAFKRLDFVQKDVEIERKLVQMEQERDRVKLMVSRLM